MMDCDCKITKDGLVNICTFHWTRLVSDPDLTHLIGSNNHDAIIETIYNIPIVRGRK